jgi:hypothetical protein
MSELFFVINLGLINSCACKFIENGKRCNQDTVDGIYCDSHRDGKLRTLTEKFFDNADENELVNRCVDAVKCYFRVTASLPKISNIRVVCDDDHFNVLFRDDNVKMELQMLSGEDGCDFSISQEEFENLREQRMKICFLKKGQCKFFFKEQLSAIQFPQNIWNKACSIVKAQVNEGVEEIIITDLAPIVTSYVF